MPSYLSNSMVFSFLEQRQTLKLQISQLLAFRKLRKILLTLNLFARRNSEASDVREQILTTRLYIGCLFVFTLILMFVTTLEQRMTTTVVSMPTISEFENLFQSGKIPNSCPCSQIAAERSAFISLTPTFHQVCSSKLVDENLLHSLNYIINSRAVDHHSDIRLYGLHMFETLGSLCSLANATTTDAMTNFLTTSWVSTYALPREQFHEQAQALITDFQTGLKNTFKQLFSLARAINQGNQLLSTRASNFFFDGLFDSNGHLINVQTYTGIKSSFNDTLSSCSCLLNTCSQPLGFLKMSDDQRTILSFMEVPGMYGACYPLDSLRVSTFECWFNETCTGLVMFLMTFMPTENSVEPLNSSMLTHFSPTTTIGEIIDDLMIEMWANITNYETYYNICKPLTCTYTSYRRFDWLYTITILTSVFGGLSVSLHIVCPLLIKLYVCCRRKRDVSTISKYLIIYFFMHSLFFL